MSRQDNQLHRELLSFPKKLIDGQSNVDQINSISKKSYLYKISRL